MAMKIEEMAQEGLVSTLLYLPENVKDVMGFLGEDEFSNGRMKTIYHAVLELSKSNQPITYASVVSWLDLNGRLQPAGGPEELRRLFGDGAMNGSVHTIEYWARIVKEAALKEQTGEILDKAKKDLAKPGVRTKTIIGNVQSDSNDVLMRISDNADIVDLKDYYPEYFDEIKERRRIYQESGGNPLAANHGIPSGFPTIDKIVGGWKPGQYITVAGRTSVGKSFTVSNFLISACADNKSVLFFSAEMPKNEIVDRLLAAISNVKYAHVQKGNLTDEDMEHLSAAHETFDKMKIKIDCTPGMDMNHIKAESMKAATSDNGLDMVIIDYLQLITPDNPRDQREQQVAKISWSIKMLAASLKIPVISVCQLNRIKKDDEDPTPRIDDIRESGRIAQDSAVIILIDRDITNTDPHTPTTFIIGKNRNGKTGIRFKCHTLLSYGKFKEMNETGDMFDEDGEPKQTEDTGTAGESAGTRPVVASGSSTNDDKYAPTDPDKMDAWLGSESSPSDFDKFDF